MANNLMVGDYIDKVEGFGLLSQVEQVKLIAYFYCVTSENLLFNTSSIRECFIDCDLRPPGNISDCVGKLTIGKNAPLLKKSGFYTFQRDSKKQLDDIYLGNRHKQEISVTLRSLLPKVTSIEQRIFLEEAITCFEVKCSRAAIVMTWLLAMDILYEFVITKHLVVFNSAIQSHGKYKKITISKKEDFTDIKESHFIELLRVANLITNDVRKILDEKLNFRNTAAHPNIIKIKETKAISFIEDLTDNVIIQYQ